jgi:hypothetical protein
MAGGEAFGALQASFGARRPLYEVGSYLAAEDLSTEQQYRTQRLRRHRRYLHGWGVVCGLLVVPARDPGRPWAVSICPGYALGPWGDEIVVQASVMLDIRDYLWTRPHIGGPATRLAYIAIRYDEEPARPVAASPPGCRCDDTSYANSRIRDGFQLSVLWARPDAHPERVDLCARRLPKCPECPDSPDVILARVALPANESDPIAAANIDNWSYRRRLCTIPAEQQQLMVCCCIEKPAPPPAPPLPS